MEQCKFMIINHICFKATLTYSKDSAEHITVEDIIKEGREHYPKEMHFHYKKNKKIVLFSLK